MMVCVETTSQSTDAPIVKNVSSTISNYFLYRSDFAFCFHFDLDWFGRYEQVRHSISQVLLMP